MKKTDATLRFLDMWIEKLCDRNEQFLLNEIIHEQYGSIWNIPWIHVDVFTSEKFQRGFDAFKLKWWRRDDKVCIHVNYVF